VWRCCRSKMILKRKRLEFTSARLIQCAFRVYRACKLVARLRKEELQRRQRIGATQFQRVVRGHLARLRANHLRRIYLGARGLQRIFRGYRDRIKFYVDIAHFRGAKQMQRIFRGFKKRVWYKNLRRVCSTRIQTFYRAYVCRSWYEYYRRSAEKYHAQHTKYSSRFYTRMESLRVLMNSEMYMRRVRIPNVDGEEPKAENKQEEENVADEQDEASKIRSVDDSCVANTSGETPINGDENDRPVTAPAEVQAEGLLAPVEEVNPHGKSEFGFANIEDLNGVVLATDEPLRDNGKTAVKWLTRNSREASSLWVANWKFGPKGASRFAKILQENESLTELGLGEGCEIGPRGAEQIAEAMRCHNFRLTRLFINDQPELGDLGGFYFMQTIGDFFFGRYSRLQEISLRNIGLGDRSCVSVAEGLSLNNKLKSLQLENNVIGDDGAVALAAMFDRQETLIELNLSGNSIGCVGAVALAKMVENAHCNVCLEVLNLENNFIKNGGGSAIARALTACNKSRRPMCISIRVNPMQPRIHKRVRKLSTDLPPFCQRTELSVARMVPLARTNEDDNGQEDGPSDEEPDEEDNNMDIFKPLKTEELPPLKLGPQFNKRRSPYRTLPWAPPNREPIPMSVIRLLKRG